MPANMRKAGMKYQKGGSKKKSETLGQATKRVAKKVDDALEKVTSGAINKIPAYKKTKNLVKYAMGMQSGGSTKKRYGHGGPKASDYVGNPMGYFNDKAAYGKETMMQAGGTVNKPKRRTVSVNTQNPRKGTVGGIPTTTKTVTKKRGNKTITKTKSVNNPMNPFAKSSVSKSKTVTKGSGPTKQTVKSSGSNKSVSKNKGKRIQSRMQSRKGATTTTPGKFKMAGPGIKRGPGSSKPKPFKRKG